MADKERQQGGENPRLLNRGFWYDEPRIRIRFSGKSAEHDWFDVFPNVNFTDTPVGLMITVNGRFVLKGSSPETFRLDPAEGVQ